VLGPSTQFRLFARILAIEVFPTPLGPVNRKAWAIRLLWMALCSISVT